MTPTTAAGRALLDGGPPTFEALAEAIAAIEREKDEEYEKVVDLYRRQRDEAAQQERERCRNRIAPLAEVPFANEDTRKAYRLAITDALAILAEPNDDHTVTRTTVHGQIERWQDD